MSFRFFNSTSIRFGLCNRLLDAFDEDFAELQEEVLAEDGEMEEYFAYDQPAVYVSSDAS